MVSWSLILGAAPYILESASKLIISVKKTKESNLEISSHLTTIDERVEFLEKNNRNLLKIVEEQSVIIQELAKQQNDFLNRIKWIRVAVIGTGVCSVIAIVLAVVHF